MASASNWPREIFIRAGIKLHFGDSREGQRETEREALPCLRVKRRKALNNFPMGRTLSCVGGTKTAEKVGVGSV